ncbi:MAG: 4a-hydroxytetrahydrobiopterin dehydratase [Bacteroidales bacterium]|nr:4a-hydroxytetrahydrobiopterin dehydratase [Bacteroidales bacterium]MCF8456659.1 4a-hydroxytetrahydrobiopterin dehydratase [Bacteroidales bacterium]
MKYWEETDNKLTREFSLSDFKSCLIFVNKVAAVADEMNHHPDILIHSYNKVKISTYTHSQNRISDKDFVLCQKINEIL